MTTILYTCIEIHHTPFIFIFSVQNLPSLELKVFDADAEHNGKEYTKCNMQNCDQDEVVILEA